MAKRSSIVALRMHTIVGLVFDLVDFCGDFEFGGLGLGFFSVWWEFLIWGFLWREREGRRMRLKCKRGNWILNIGIWFWAFTLD